MFASENLDMKMIVVEKKRSGKAFKKVVDVFLGSNKEKYYLVLFG